MHKECAILYPGVHDVIHIDHIRFHGAFMNECFHHKPTNNSDLLNYRDTKYNGITFFLLRYMHIAKPYNIYYNILV